MTWDENNYMAVTKSKPSVRALRTGKVRRYRPGLDSVSSDNFIKGIAKVGIKLFTKDPAKEAEKLKKLEGDKFLGGLDKAIKGATALGAAVVGANALGNKLKKESTPAPVVSPASNKIDTSGFKPTPIVKPAISLPGTSNAPVTSVATPSPFQSVTPTDLERPIGQAPVATGLANKVMGLFDDMPQDVKQEIKQRGQSLIDEGKGALTDAQKRLQNASASAGLLPKTKRLKEAEQLATTPGYGTTEIAGIDSRIVYGVAFMFAMGVVIYFVTK